MYIVVGKFTQKPVSKPTVEHMIVYCNHHANQIYCVCMNKRRWRSSLKCVQKQQQATDINTQTTVAVDSVRTSKHGIDGA